MRDLIAGKSFNRFDRMYDHTAGCRKIISKIFGAHERHLGTFGSRCFGNLIIFS